MTNMHDQPAIEVEWECINCGSQQIEAVTEFHDSTDPLICGNCLNITGVMDLDREEATAYFVAMKQAKAMEVK